MAENAQPAVATADEASALAAELTAVRAELAACQEKLRVVEREQSQLLETLRELRTPVLPIHNGILVLPLIGHLDSSRGDHLMDDLLTAIQHHQADVVLIDITGVSIVDTSVANSVVQATRAAALVGTTCALVGVSSEVARTLVHLGVNLGKIATKRDLQAGINFALKRRGFAIVREREEVDWLSEIDGENDRSASGSAVDDGAAAALQKNSAIAG